MTIDDIAYCVHIIFKLCEFL